jgi:hypothetical protein
MGMGKPQGRLRINSWFWEPEPRMSNANAVAAVENFWREVWPPPQNPDAIDHLVAEDFVLTSDGTDFVSRATSKQWVIDFQSKITHLEFDILETFQNAEGTRVASRWQIRGKNNGILGTEPDQRLYRDRSLGGPARRRYSAQFGRAQRLGALSRLDAVVHVIVNRVAIVGVSHGGSYGYTRKV